jgi:predicted nicotinamide N-methyase
MFTDKRRDSIRVEAAGRVWTLWRPADLESLWEAMTNPSAEAGEEALSGPGPEDERIPYWVEVWPASLVLAEWLLERRESLAGRACLDLGCGLGLSALVASGLGARVLAVDYEKSALDFSRLNERENSASPSPGAVLWTLADWRVPAFKARAFDFIWGGDIMYERRFILPVLNCLEYALAPGGRVWMADPGRDVYADFLEALKARGWSCAGLRAVPASALRFSGQSTGMNVNLWELGHE